MPESLTAEAARIMTVCNACRYCEGHCAVFPAMERRLQFDEHTIDFLSNLCHQCGACYQHCQYADPHEFNINVPRVFRQSRLDSYARYLRPSFMRWSVTNAKLFTLLGLAAAGTVFLLAVVLQVGAVGLLSPAEDFYTLMPHTVMAGLFSFAGIIVLVSWWVSLSGYWQALGLPAPYRIHARAYRLALLSAATLKNLGGGHGDGCYEAGEVPSHAIRWSHHLVVTGFLLCFAATLLGTFYHYALQSPAPYDWLSWPKLFGVSGGVLLVAGCLGLLRANRQTDERLTTVDGGYGQSLTWLLLLTSLTGLALPMAKGTIMLGPLLVVHLAVVFTLFLNFAWGKFTHSLFRLVALINDEHEKDVQATL